MLFDTHVHLNDPVYENIDLVIDSALKQGVKMMVVVGYDLESSITAVEIAKKYPFIYASVGIHPSEANKEYDDDLKKMEALICPRVVAIGEIGLDYHYPDCNKELQKDLFVKQIKLSQKYNLPILVHSRDACNDTYKILKENKDDKAKGIMHCYSYSYEMSKEFLKLNLLIGVGGVVTFKNAKEIKEIVKDIELKNIVLETDAPYLAPTPYRGQTNEPKYIKLVAEEIANIRGENIETIENETFNNALHLFGVKYED